MAEEFIRCKCKHPTEKILCVREIGHDGVHYSGLVGERRLRWFWGNRNNPVRLQMESRGQANRTPDPLP